MISSIEITNFRGIREGKLENLTPLTILVGPNGCGKSTVLDAMLIGTSQYPGTGVTHVVQRHSDVKEGARWLFWRGGAQKAFRVGTVLDGARHNWQWTLQPEPTTSGNTKNVILLVGMYGGPGPDQAKAVPVFFEPGGRLPTVEDNAFQETPIDAPTTRLVEPCGGSRPVHRQVSALIESGRLKDVIGVLNEVVPGLRDIRILTEHSDATDRPIVHLVFDAYSIPAALAGDGIHALLQLGLELISMSAGTMLLEEPEAFQHPGAMRQTARVILAAVRRNVQVILTTHSLEFIDVLLAEANDEDVEKLSLYRLELNRGRLISVQSLGPQVAFCRGDIERDLR